MADYVRDMHGEAAYEAFLDEMQRMRESETMPPPKKPTRRRSHGGTMKRFYRYWKAFVTKLTDDR
ncbi:hypothetical protein MMC07_002284 [Pseudocyphellaria aurata]|nr:hypothetical protein [Pseudocyphellaria aurata]